MHSNVLHVQIWVYEKNRKLTKYCAQFRNVLCALSGSHNTRQGDS